MNYSGTPKNRGNQTGGAAAWPGGSRAAFALAGATAGGSTSAPLSARGARRSGAFVAVLLTIAACAALVFTVLAPTGSSVVATARTTATTAPAVHGWATVSVSEQAAVSRSLGADQHTYWASAPSHATVAVRNPSQSLSASFNDGRVAVSGQRGLRFGLSALEVGRVGSLASVALGSAEVSHNRIAYTSPAIAEWFVNGPLGVEQGFTLAHRAAGSGALQISQQLAGNLTGSVSAGGADATFSSRAGTLHYENLVVTDARGARVPARLSIAADRLTITINDTHAVYPLRVDPVIVTPVTQNPVSDATTGAAPYSVAFSPNGKLLATVNYIDSSVSVFTVDQATGQVTPVVQNVAANADTDTGPFSVAFSPNSGLLATANFRSNDVSIFTVDPNTGQLTPVTQTVAGNADTPLGPFTATFSPNGDELATANWRSNSVSIFTVDPSTGQLTPVVQSVAANADTGANPAAVAFSPSGDLLATANGGSSTVSMFAIDPASGQLTPVTQSAPADSDTGTTPYSIAFSPDGGLLATANYNADTVSVFTVDPTSGALTPVTQSAPANADTGAGPAAIAFSSNWDLLATSNYNADTVSLFTIDPTSGQLTPVTETPASSLDTGVAPVSLAFSPNDGLLATANLSDDTVSLFTVTGPATQVALALAPASITANGTASTVATVTVTDTNGNPVSGDSVTITSNGAQQVSAVTAGSAPGTYLATITSTTTAGAASITATDTSVNGGVSASQKLIQTAGPATNVALALAPSSIPADGTSTSVATATVTDAFGNPVSGDVVTITSNDLQQVGAVTAGSTPGTYLATITSTTTAGAASITATDTSAAKVSASQALTQTALPLASGGTLPLSSSPPPPAFTFKVLSEKRMSNGSIVVKVNVTGPGELHVVGVHPSASGTPKLVGLSLVSSHELAWGPVTITRLARGTFKFTLHPDRAAKKLIKNARRIGSRLRVRITIAFSPSIGSAQKEIINVQLLKARKA
jgi:6-phosphogluconolactonase (cycloisomerase 2 family)